MVITRPNCSFNDCATLFVFWPEMSIPASFITSLARGLEALRSIPTLTISNRSPVRLRRKPSAIKLRVALPVDRNRTFSLWLAISPISSTRSLSTGVVSHPHAGTSHGARQSRFAQYWKINVARPRVVPPITDGAPTSTKLLRARSPVRGTVMPLLVAVGQIFSNAVCGQLSSSRQIGQNIAPIPS